MRFSYSGKDDMDARLVSFGCPANVAYFGAQTRVLDRSLTAAIVAMAGGYGLSGAPAPDLYGKGPSDATQVAQSAGFTLNFLGEEIDSLVPSGVVLLQNPPAGRAGIGNQIDVILAVHPSPVCTSSQIALDYYGGGAGAGNDFGTIEIRDVDAQACLLLGPIDVTGLDRDHRPDTQTISYPVEPSLILSAHTDRRPVGQTEPLGQTVADVTLAAEYRDDPTSPNGLCSDHVIIPALWRVALPSGTLTVANSSNDPTSPNFSSLQTCKGQLDTPQPISAH